MHMYNNMIICFFYVFLLSKIHFDRTDRGGLVAHLAGTLTQLRSLLPEAKAAEATATLPEVRGGRGIEENCDEWKTC